MGRAKQSREYVLRTKEFASASAWTCSIGRYRRWGMTSVTESQLGSEDKKKLAI